MTSLMIDLFAYSPQQSEKRCENRHDHHEVLRRLTKSRRKINWAVKPECFSAFLCNNAKTKARTKQDMFLTTKCKKCCTISDTVWYGSLEAGLMSNVCRPLLFMKKSSEDQGSCEIRVGLKCFTVFATSYKSFCISYRLGNTSNTCRCRQPPM